MIYIFEGASLDAERREVRRGSDLISIEPQVFDLLLLLIRNRTRVVSKDDMVAEVWCGRIVSESTLYSRIAAARQAIGDSGEEQRLIRTVARKGLRFVADVREVETDTHAPVPCTVSGTPKHEVAAISDDWERPTLVVMPFDNLSKPSDEYLVDGLVEDITLALSRVSDFCVIARDSAFAFKGKGKPVDAREVRRKLGARYVVEGTAQRDGDHLRISVRLVDGETSIQLWSERYTGGVADIFEFQDHIAAQVAGTVQPRVRNRELDLGRRKPNLAAYDCVLRGISIQYCGHATIEEAKEAVAWFDRALELDPSYARALAWRACAAAGLWPLQPTEEHLDRNLDLVSRALSIDPADSEAHRIKGALHTLRRQFDQAAYHLERARVLNPNDAHILVKGGFYLSLLGEHEQGLNDIDLAIQRNPLHPDWYWRERGIVLFGLGTYREALNALQRCQEGRDLDHIYQAACLVALGEDVTARKCLEDLRQTRPEVTSNWIKRAIPYRCYKNPADLSRLTGFLETAGLGA
ncbi:MAG: winged helix-turn-helix domain-containing protein [Hyphomicrobiaceae bacterium]